MKAIAILDLIEMPTVCKECRFREGALKGDDLVWLCHLNDEYVELNTKSDYCPLRPIPTDACKTLIKGLDAWEGMRSVEVSYVRRTE